MLQWAAPALALRALLLLWIAAAVVDDSGRYRQGGDISSLAPPEPSEEDRNAGVDLSKQPIEKLFGLLAYELMKEERRLPEQRVRLRDFQAATELPCQERLLLMLHEAHGVSEDVKEYHLNVTGTAGLYWLLHKYPEEHSWVWLLSVSQDRVMRKVMRHLMRLASLAVDDSQGCVTPGVRNVLMNFATTWRRLHGDHVALIWNGMAFGALGDVTAWREVDEEGHAEAGPGGPPPNVSWAENLIFGNMWISSVQKGLERHSGELADAVRVEVSLQLSGQRATSGRQWNEGQDGILSSFEFIRRQTFSVWELDKGLLRGMLRHCLKPGYGASQRVSVADFGAGGGRYSEWLNDTGLVDAIAVDGTQSVGDITGGAVLEVDLSQEVDLWRRFDWVLCLELGPWMPKQHAAALLRNVKRHATHGLVMSWSQGGPVDGGPSSVLHPLDEAGFVELVERQSGFRQDTVATAAIRRGCELDHLAKTTAVFRASPVGPAPA